jgi:hypothetical protein
MAQPILLENVQLYLTQTARIYIYIYIERAPTRGDPNRIVPKEKKR